MQECLYTPERMFLCIFCNIWMHTRFHYLPINFYTNTETGGCSKNHGCTGNGSEMHKLLSK